MTSCESINLGLWIKMGGPDDRGALLTIATIGYDFNRRVSYINGDLIDASGM
jgi:hypothetical protein